MLVTDGVRRRFGATEALRGVSLTVPAGATLGLLGPNGAGKTTLMRSIMGVALPDAGTISWNGAPIDAATRRRFGYLPEERGLYQKLRVREHIVYFAQLHGVARDRAESAAAGLIDRLGLSAHAAKPCGTLSKGNQQKVQIASTIAHDPELLILDEPFSGLDFENAEVLLDVLAGLKAKGTTMILSSHQLWQIEQTCDVFAIVSNGELRAEGTLASLRAGWPVRTIAIAPAVEAIRAELERLNPLALRLSGDSIEADVDPETDLTGLARRISAAAEMTRFGVVEPPLAALYARAIGQA
jgi:ABC-2 type transport system ATP-binding protein